MDVLQGADPVLVQLLLLLKVLVQLLLVLVQPPAAIVCVLCGSTRGLRQ